MEMKSMLRRAWIAGLASVVLLGGSLGFPQPANAQGIWFGGVGFGGPGFYGGGFGPSYGFGGWGFPGGYVPARVSYPVVVSRPVVAYPRPVVVAPTPYAYRYANRAVRRAWRRGW
jgi:hypothetical protein